MVSGESFIFVFFIDKLFLYVEFGIYIIIGIYVDILVFDY